jgi:hypothetical protein
LSSVVEEIEKKIAIDKELIDVSSRKGIKAIRTLRSEIKTFKETYEKMLDEVTKEIENRFNDIEKIEVDPEVENLSRRLEELNKVERICDEERTNYERVKLDRIVYHLNGFYKKDLKTINSYIYEFLDIFKEIGIELKPDDFTISRYAKQYISVLIEEEKNGTYNQYRIEEEFEKIYWECSDLLLHVLISVRFIYDQNEKRISKIYKEKIAEILRNLGIVQKDFEDEIAKEKSVNAKKIRNIKAADRKEILNAFVNKEVKVSDFTESNYNNLYNKLTMKNPKELDQETKVSYDMNLKNFYYNLLEYSLYTKYKFIIDHITNMRNKEIKNADLKKVSQSQNAEDDDKKSKSKNKKVSEIDEVQNKIKDVTSKVLKLNAKNGKKKGFLFFKQKLLKANNKQTDLEINNKILELKDLYAQYDKIFTNDRLLKIDNAATLLDLFIYASYDYGFLAKLVIAKEPDIVEKDLEIYIQKYKDEISKFDFEIINHIAISDNKQVAVVIKDKYKLLGLIVLKENFDGDELGKLINTVKIINMYNEMKKINLSTKDVEFYLKAKEILNK